MAELIAVGLAQHNRPRRFHPRDRRTVEGWSVIAQHFLSLPWCARRLSRSDLALPTGTPASGWSGSPFAASASIERLCLSALSFDSVTYVPIWEIVFFDSQQKVLPCQFRGWWFRLPAR